MKPIEDIVNELQTEDLGLAGLHLNRFRTKSKEEIKRHFEEIKKQREEYMEKYGDKWIDHYIEEDPNIAKYDVDMKWINHAIYLGEWTDHHRLLRRQQNRLKELFHHDFEIFESFDGHEAEIALIGDALRTGKWEELPDPLIPKYQERMSNDEGI